MKRHIVAVVLLLASMLRAAGGVHATNVNQRVNGGVWVDLGTFIFQGGVGEYIEISNAGANGYVIADAVRFSSAGVTNTIDDENNACTEAHGVWQRSSRRHTTHAGKFDHYPLTGMRNTRRIMGDHVISVLDQYRGRTYADVIAVASSNFDNHGYHKGKPCYAGLFPGGRSFVPYRSFLPLGLENVLVVGRCRRTGGVSRLSTSGLSRR